VDAVAFVVVSMGLVIRICG